MEGTKNTKLKRIGRKKHRGKSKKKQDDSSNTQSLPDQPETFFSELPSSVAVIAFMFNPFDIWPLVLLRSDVRNDLKKKLSSKLDEFYTTDDVFALLTFMVKGQGPKSFSQLHCAITSFVKFDVMLPCLDTVEDFTSLFGIVLCTSLPANVLDILVDNHWNLNDLIKIDLSGAEVNNCDHPECISDRMKGKYSNIPFPKDEMIRNIHKFYDMIEVLGGHPMRYIRFNRKTSDKSFDSILERILKSWISESDCKERLECVGIGLHPTEIVNLLREMRYSSRESKRIKYLASLLDNVFSRIFTGKKFPIDSYSSLLSDPIFGEIASKYLRDEEEDFDPAFSNIIPKYTRGDNNHVRYGNRRYNRRSPSGVRDPAAGISLGPGPYEKNL